MTIKIYNYSIRKSENGNSRFDLHITKETKTGKTKGKLSQSPIAYGVSLERAIKLIIDEETDNRFDDVDLEEFIENYKEVCEDVLKKLEQNK